MKPPLAFLNRRLPHERRRSGQAVHRCDDGFSRASRAYARGGCLMSFLSSPACLPLPSVGDGTAALVTVTTGAATPVLQLARACSSPRAEARGVAPFPLGQHLAGAALEPRSRPPVSFFTSGARALAACASTSPLHAPRLTRRAQQPNQGRPTPTFAPPTMNKTAAIEARGLSRQAEIFSEEWT
jgi:hypothetical protein